MLDNETKRRIETARDILVGKLPDPKSQVEQITIALIYKFMDDMDAQSVEYGGKPSFFVGDYEKYGWRKIFSPGIGGHEMLNLYGEAITSLNQNPHLPQLFRDVFKNAFLPYRDPETLKLFLKTINEFKYDHSERLCDAFEYLLSVLGSQGDAGQFRTPRHIIDFIVEVVQPRKDETVCDPACGTAGFLISSYKHILRANTRNTPGDLLTPDERKKLVRNFVGYDISPDMVRLSLVNMYLHGFPDPHIYEYDTLTSDERWNETFDVIMANPPFMSPKGGIKPHKKFSLQANRSEVLFADYIAEHINPVSGRAGMIVPEGIIFQSGTAYKNLRKMLVEKNYLYAVVSLPAGVFQPYSGVKTSILFFDKTLASKTDRVLFVKINNDGFSLGAQRKELKTSDLPDALNVILDFQKAILTDAFLSVPPAVAGGLTSPKHPPATAVGTDPLAEGNLPLQAFAVEKSRIAENADFNLLGDRYKAAKTTHKEYEMASLGEICDIFNGSTPSRTEISYWEKGSINWFTVEDVREQGRVIRYTKQTITEKALKETSVKLLPPETVLLCCTASVGEYAFAEVPLTTNQQFNGLVIKQDYKSKIIPKYLFHIASSFKDSLMRLGGTTSFKFVSVRDLKTIKIPLPPLSAQKEMVERVEGYQRLIDGAKQVVQSFKPNIQINPDWETVSLSEIVESTQLGLVKSKGEQGKREEGFNVPYVKMDCITMDGNLNLAKVVYVKATSDEIERFTLDDGDFFYNTRNAPDLVGKSAVYHGQSGNCLFNNNILRIKFSDNVVSDFINLVLNSPFGKAQIRSLVAGTTSVAAIYQKEFLTIQVPLPSLEEQKQIVAQIEREQQLVNANRELIAIYEQKIKDEINKLWEN